MGREARILITGTPTNPSVHFDAADETSLAPQLYRQHVILAGIVRRQVFVDELGRAEAEFEVTEADRAFRHVLIRSECRMRRCCVCTTKVCAQLRPLLFQRVMRCWAMYDGVPV